MKSIWKFPLEITDLQPVNMPAGADILCVHTQRGMPCLWALCEPGVPLEPNLIRTIGTGHQIPEYPGRYIGTYLIEGDSLVFHVFETRSVDYDQEKETR